MFDDSDIEEIKPIFLEESYEGLGVMEAGLLNLDLGAADLDTVNDIFRAAHSIKGGAATFGFSQVSEFTHGVETLLDEMRAGERTVTAEVVNLLLGSVDCLREMLDAIKDNEEATPELATEISQRIKATLDAGTAEPPLEPPVDILKETAPETAMESDTATPISIGEWLINYKPEGSIFKTGNDPVHIFRELASLGELTVETDLSKLPDLKELDPENCYLGWSLKLTAQTDEATILAAFDWVIDACELEIVPPASASIESGTSAIEEVSQQVGMGNDESELDLTETAADEAPEGQPVLAENTAEPKNPPQLKVIEGKEDRRSQRGNDRRRSDRRSGGAESGSIRVDIDKVDTLLNLVGELVITQSSLSRFQGDFEEEDLIFLRDGLAELSRTTRELQESAMQVRMLPMKVTFGRFPRLVHDLSSQLNKKIDLNLYGENTELDKTVLEKIGDPLVHLVRNSIDHGVEDVEGRIAAGKPETGTVKLGAYHEAGNIVIEVSDDGAGLNKDRILEKAKQRGLISEDAILTDNQIHSLIFEPGFSTADKVTDVSGRGVGMDVVKRNIMELGGRIEVESERGKGTKFLIRLPLTLAILDGQLVRIGNSTFVIPVLSITESIVLDPDKLNIITGQTCVYQFREQNIPVVNVSDIWKFTELSEVESDREKKLLVVLKSGNDLVGLIVDDLLEQQQVVIKSLETNYQQIEGLAGATILGDGTVVLIFDIPGLVHICVKGTMNKRTEIAV